MNIICDQCGGKNITIVSDPLPAPTTLNLSDLANGDGPTKSVTIANTATCKDCQYHQKFNTSAII